MTKLQTLKGFRDFLPVAKTQRDLVKAKIEAAFLLAGFAPLETPTLEYKETIMGKYGSEADKLVYEFTDRGGREVALRYDQTVPSARVIAQYQNELVFPFRRYQIQNVFRADKPQQGRYREFTQCDIDIFGGEEPVADAEILATTYQAFKNIGLTDVQLLINDRRTLFATLEQFAAELEASSILQSIDKLDKVSPQEVVAELVSKGLSQSSADQVLNAIVNLQPSNQLEAIKQATLALGVPESALKFTPTLARGLDYYTGLIFEIVLPTWQGGSLGGGGRYDNLINDLSGVQVSAVGVGIGFDRTVEAALQLGLIPENIQTAQVLVTVFAPNLISKSAQVASKLRLAGISSQLYSKANDKLGKQFKFANRLNIPNVIVVGDEESRLGVVTLKNLLTGEQQQLLLDEVIKQLKATA